MPFLRGMGMSAGMIIALGPQNLYLLRHGLLGNTSVFRIAVIYILIDVVLISLGAMGAGTLIANVPTLKLVLSVVAAGFFLFYGLASIRRGLAPRSGAVECMDEGGGYWTAVLLSIGNPGVLFDTIVIVGGLAGQYGELSDRLSFSMGAATVSCLWFSMLSAMSLFAGSFVKSREAWRIIEISIGLLMILMSLFVIRDIFFVE